MRLLALSGNVLLSNEAAVKSKAGLSSPEKIEEICSRIGRQARR
jgi:hypothetical protein